ncbi:MAG: Transcription termination factor Rho [Parcubacteria group bacterium GW2011_GWC2_39_14]|nr:MAG: Transcription termination factor Rho [Parcubacteria group bacterium GW2011_GWC2_39_14]KKR54627.1 MAG: Transcription termination factor Rho [Parcubacteria group bacterium GW2011_GWA2_40_23]
MEVRHASRVDFRRSRVGHRARGTARHPRHQGAEVRVRVRRRGRTDRCFGLLQGTEEGRRAAPRAQAGRRDPDRRRAEAADRRHVRDRRRRRAAVPCACRRPQGRRGEAGPRHDRGRRDQARGEARRDRQGRAGSQAGHRQAGRPAHRARARDRDRRRGRAARVAHPDRLYGRVPGDLGSVLLLGRSRERTNLFGGERVRAVPGRIWVTIGLQAPPTPTTTSRPQRHLLATKRSGEVTDLPN